MKQLANVIFDGLPGGCLKDKAGSELFQYSSSHSVIGSTSKLSSWDQQAQQSTQNDLLLLVYRTWPTKSEAGQSVHRNQYPTSRVGCS